MNWTSWISFVSLEIDFGFGKIRNFVWIKYLLFIFQIFCCTLETRYVHTLQYTWQWVFIKKNTVLLSCVLQRVLSISSHLSTAVAWREKKYKHFVFNKYFCLVLGLLKSRISKKSFELLLRKLNFKLFHYGARVQPVSKITTIATRNRFWI